MDPALLCTATGDVEQTISQIQTRGEHGRFIFICVIRIVAHYTWPPTRGRQFDSVIALKNIQIWLHG